MIAEATMILAKGLLSAGTTYQGESLVAVSLIASSYASIYWSQNFLSFASEEENFQFFSGLLILSRNLFFCSFAETFRKNLHTTTPFRFKYFSKFLISCSRSFQMSLVINSGGIFC